jgi:hypothetical protein
MKRIWRDRGAVRTVGDPGYRHMAEMLQAGCGHGAGGGCCSPAQAPASKSNARRTQPKSDMEIFSAAGSRT